MDALSDVLSTLKLKSTLSSRLEAAGLWAFRFPGHDQPHIKFGSVIRGPVQIRVEGMRAPMVFETGDFYLLTSRKSLVTSSVPPARQERDVEAYRAARDADGVVRIGDGEVNVMLQNGRFTFEGEASELLLRHLPPLLRLRAGNPACATLSRVLELLHAERDDTLAGAAVARASLASLLLVQALRIHLAETPQPPGWLGALADLRVGAALSAMHGDLTQRWTVESLAGHAGMSRTAFAERFRLLVGASPLDYLTGWRMAVARTALRDGDAALARVAERVGYASETAFSAAFKRATGESPGVWRATAREAARPSTREETSLIEG